MSQDKMKKQNVLFFLLKKGGITATGEWIFCKEVLIFSDALLIQVHFYMQTQIICDNKFVLNDSCISNHSDVKYCNQLPCKHTFWNSWSGVIRNILSQVKLNSGRILWLVFSYELSSPWSFRCFHSSSNFVMNFFNHFFLILLFYPLI